MKTRPVKTLAFFCLFVALMTACKKNKEEDASVTGTIAGTYALSSYIESSALSGDKDLLIEMDACKRDDEYVLHSDYSYLYKDIGTACTTNGSHPGIWLLSGENLTFDQYTGKIEMLTAQQLVITYNFFLGGINYTRRAVFDRK